MNVFAVAERNQGMNKPVPSRSQGNWCTFSDIIHLQIVDRAVLSLTQRFADMEYLSFFYYFPSSELAQLIKMCTFFDELDIL